MSKTSELHCLAQIFDDWLKPAPHVPAVYLFGSRVRGDHHPDSDVDVRLFTNEWSNVDRVDMEWWTRENETDFADLKRRLPGPLAIHREKFDAADPAILEGRKKPVLVVGRVFCVTTPKK